MSPKLELLTLQTVMIWGPPKSGKSTLAREIAATYTAGLLSIDEVVMEAIMAPGESAAAKKARELCEIETRMRVENQSGDSVDEITFKDSDSVTKVRIFLVLEVFALFFVKDFEKFSVLKTTAQGIELWTFDL